MDEVGCGGNEPRLVDCPFPGFGVVNCGGNLVVEVTCRKRDPFPLPSLGDIRFVNVRQGIGEVRGRVEVFNLALWVRVCDDNFDIFDAGVACRQLGYSSIGKFKMCRLWTFGLKVMRYFLLLNLWRHYRREVASV